MLTAYIVAAALCFGAAKKCAGHLRYRRGDVGIRTMRRERVLWEAIAAFLVIGAVYRQLDLANLVTGLGRAVATNGNWYDQRRPFQAAALGTVVIVVVAGAAVLFRAMSAVNPRALIALAVCTMLVLLLSTRALSLHGTDTLLHSGYGRANVYNIVELGSIATILAASLLYRQEVLVVLRRCAGRRVPRRQDADA